MEANDGRQAQGAYIPQELLKEISKVNNRLLIGIPRERCEAEKRLPLTPEAVDMLTDCGHRVLVESGAGLGACQRIAQQHASYKSDRNCEEQ